MSSKLVLGRYQAVLAKIAAWEAKERRARNRLRKLRKQRAYYLRMLGPNPGPTEQAKADRKASAAANRAARAARPIGGAAEDFVRVMDELYRTEAEAYDNPRIREG